MKDQEKDKKEEKKEKKNGETEREEEIRQASFLMRSTWEIFGNRPEPIQIGLAD